jgi:hypothetical protein
MLCTFLLLTGLVAACVVAPWPKIRRALRDAVRKPAGPAAPGGPGTASAPNRSPQTLEGILTLELVAGEITGPQYRQAMATVAARDAERHPLEVPPEVTPPEPA